MLPIQLGKSRMPLRAIDYALPVASAQIKSCLLLAGLAAAGTTTLREPGPSRDHTERMLNNLGIPVTSERLAAAGDQLESYVTRLEPPRPLILSPLNLDIPGDISAAAFLIVAALIAPNSQVTLERLGLKPDPLRDHRRAPVDGRRHPNPFDRPARRRARRGYHCAHFGPTRHAGFRPAGGTHDRRVPGICGGGCLRTWKDDRLPG